MFQKVFGYFNADFKAEIPTEDNFIAFSFLTCNFCFNAKSFIIKLSGVYCYFKLFCYIQLSRLKRELAQMKQELQYKEKGVETLQE